jgi:hypothetical protein
MNILELYVISIYVFLTPHINKQLSVCIADHELSVLLLRAAQGIQWEVGRSHVYRARY